jgi:hypothetical protein
MKNLEYNKWVNSFFLIQWKKKIRTKKIRTISELIVYWNDEKETDNNMRWNKNKRYSQHLVWFLKKYILFDVHVVSIYFSSLWISSFNWSTMDIVILTKICFMERREPHALFLFEYSRMERISFAKPKHRWWRKMTHM